MKFRFRARVQVKPFTGKILRPDGSGSQSEFFQGTTGAVIRYDEAKGGYLVVLDCPEIKAAMGETITAYFSEHELEESVSVISMTYATSGYSSTGSANPQASFGPFEYPSDSPYLPNQIQFAKPGSNPTINL